MEREVRYCTTEDGVRIAYCVEGEGPPLFLLQFFVESFSLLPSLRPEWETFLQELALGRTLVRCDARGTGLSQREVNDSSHDALVRDMEAVVAAVKMKRFAIFAQTSSVPRAIEYTARHAQQVTHLILAGGFPRLTDVMPPQTLDSFAQLARSNWPLAAQAMTDLRGRQYASMGNVEAAALYIESSSGTAVAQLLTQNKETDVTGVLSRVKAQTLILHGVRDEFAPMRVAQGMAAGIPGARLVTLSEGDSRWVSGFSSPFTAPDARRDDDAVIAAVAEFLNEGRADAPKAIAQPKTAVTFRTVLFTDIVQHTEMMSRLGDERGRAVLREHERITREVLKANGGTEVKMMGDGFMASFGSVTKAVDCAVALQRAIEEWNTGVGAHHDAPLRVRVGLNAGEPIEEEGDLFGATVILASRIAAKAEGGEVLVADTVRGLCSGKGFSFADRGDFVAKGFEEPVRVYEVRWQKDLQSLEVKPA